MKHEIYDGNFPIRALKINRYQWISLRQRSSTDLIVVDDVKSIELSAVINLGADWWTESRSLGRSSMFVSYVPIIQNCKKNYFSCPLLTEKEKAGFIFWRKSQYCDAIYKLNYSSVIQKLICHQVRCPKCLNSINLWISMVSQHSPSLTEVDV